MLLTLVATLSSRTMSRVSEYITYSYSGASGVKRSLEYTAGLALFDISVCLDYRTRPESQFSRGRQDSRSGRCGIGNSPHAATPHRSSHHHLDSHTPISLMFSANFYPPDYGKCISPSLGSINASAKPPLQRHFADTHRDLLYVVSSRRYYFFL